MQTLKLLTVILLASFTIFSSANVGADQYKTDEGGIIPYWLALGPIPVGKDEAEKTAVSKDYLNKETTVAPVPGDKVTIDGKEYTWKLVTAAPHTPIVQGDESIGKLENAVGYLVSYVVLPKAELQAKIAWGSDDSGVVFVNGKEVNRFADGRGMGIDQNTTGAVELNKGVNTFMLKLVNRVGSWGGCVRLRGSDGKPLAGLAIQPAPAGKTAPAGNSWPVVTTTFPFEARTYKDAQGNFLLYQIMKPTNYDPKQKYPLVLYLHGAGERGADNKKQLMWITEQGNNLLVSEKALATHPCFIVVPQCPEKIKWVDTPWEADKHIMPEKPTEPMRLTIELIDALQKEFSIDAKRLYVTGMSMGGFGTWDIITRKPDMFAAAMPICGGGDETKTALIAKIPIWAFHGDKDPAVKVIRSRNMIDALKKAGGTPKYTEYPGQGHFVWIPAHGDIESWNWLFSQKK